MSDTADSFMASDRLVYLVGAQKSATSWLFSRFRDHVDVHAPKKEVHYWDTVRPPYIGWDGMGHRTPRDVNGMMSSGPEDHDRYMEQLSDGARSGATLVDFSPAYALCTGDTFAEMVRLHRETWFLFIVRDPVDRLWSGIRHRFRRHLKAGTVSRDYLFMSFDRALADPYNPDFRRSCYDQTLAALEGAVPMDRILVMSFEDMLDGGWLSLFERIGLSRPERAAMEVVNKGEADDLALDPGRRAYAASRLRASYKAAADWLGACPEAWTGSLPKEKELI